MNGETYGVHYFEKRIVGQTETTDNKESEPIIRGDFKIKYFGDSRVNAEEQYSEWWKGHQDNEMISNASFFYKEGRKDNIFYINKMELEQ